MMPLSSTARSSEEGTASPITVATPLPPATSGPAMRAGSQPVAAIAQPRLSRMARLAAEIVLAEKC